MSILTKDEIKQLALDVFRNDLHYDELLYGAKIVRQSNRIILKDQLQKSSK